MRTYLNIRGVKVPMWILMLLAIDVALVGLYIGNYAIGSPNGFLTLFVHLDRENNLPTWYSGIQWFIAGGLLAIFALLAPVRGSGIWAIRILALMFLYFSFDEITQFHEKVGGALSDIILPGDVRDRSALWRTGVWPVLLGIPGVVVLAIVVRGVRSVFLPRARQAFYLLLLGLVVMFTGALGVEMFSNVPAFSRENPGMFVLQASVEEFLEMVGVTIIVWSCTELLRVYGFALQIPASLSQAEQTQAVAAAGALASTQRSQAPHPASGSALAQH